MPAERFYVKEPFFENQSIFLKEEEFHHLSHVMRLKVGEEVELINGEGSLANATISSLEKQRALLSIQKTHQGVKPPYRLILAQALPRMPRLEYILEKSVELGVTDLWLFPGSLSEKKEISPSQNQRIHHVIISALKQCGRLFAPNLLFLPSLFSWDPASLPPHSFFGDTRAEAPFFSTLLQSQKTSSLLIAIGPEKGFHEKETLFLEQHLKGIKLHDNILRTDTAAITAVSSGYSFFKTKT